MLFDIDSDEILEYFPIESGFVFENIYITYRGDKRTLNKKDLELFKYNRRMRFPSNEEMVYDVGEDLKHKLRKIINSYNL